MAEVQQNRIISHTTQVDNGSQVFSVKTKRIQWEGQDAFIEYATDITAVSRAQQIFETQLHALLSSIPEAQGVFHLNLTQDQVLTMTGTSSNVEPLKTLLQVDALVENVASFIPDNAMRQQFLQRFRRKPLQQAYRNGKSELQQELLSYYDDKSIRWTRMTARLIANPNTGDLEAILYGMDISREKNYKARIASAQQEKSALLELADKALYCGSTASGGCPTSVPPDRLFLCGPARQLLKPLRLPAGGQVCRRKFRNAPRPF